MKLFLIEMLYWTWDWGVLTKEKGFIKHFLISNTWYIWLKVQVAPVIFLWPLAMVFSMQPPSKFVGNNPDMLYYFIFQEYRSPLGKLSYVKNSKICILSLNYFWTSWLTTHGSQNWPRFTQNAWMKAYGKKSLMIPE